MSTANPAALTETLFFGKELYSSSYICLNRKTDEFFEQIGGNHGLLALPNTPENKSLIDALNDAATHQRGGIYKMSQADYELKKKAKPFNPSELKRRDDFLKLRQSAVAPIFKPQINEANPVAPAAAAADKPGGFIPLEVPQPARIINPPQPVAVGTVDAPPTPPGETKSTFKPTTARASQKIKGTESIP